MPRELRPKGSQDDNQKSALVKLFKISLYSTGTTKRKHAKFESGYILK